MRGTAFLIVLVASAAVSGAVQFIDDFAQPDGPLADWLQVIPTARIEGERLVLEPDPLLPDQPNAWAGKAGTPIFFGGLERIDLVVEFGPAPQDAVGRHGGILFSAKTPTHRYDATFCGYFIDWIDRVEDHGFRVFRVDNGVHWLIVQGTPGIPDPPFQWSIVFKDTGFEVLGDGALVFDVADTTYRGGYFGCWCFSNIVGNSQVMYVDDVTLTLSADICPLITPAAVRPRLGEPDTVFTVDAPFGANQAGPYRVNVTSTDPTVAAIVGAAGASLELVFEQGGVLRKSFSVKALKRGTTELTVTANGAPCDGATVPIEVLRAADASFLEDFTGESDGAPVDCVVASPDVTVAAEELHLITTGLEPCAWLGTEGVPIAFNEVARISCKIRFGTSASVDIGRHGGLAFCSESAGSRWCSPNYMFDYLERDQTFRIGKGLANCGQSWLAIVGGRSDPGSEWTIELTGATMAFFVDGEKIAEVVDTERRSGYIGFWTYNNAAQELFVDDVEVVYTAGTCSTIAPAFAAVRPWYPKPVFTVEIPFGLNLTQDYTVTVKSSNPATAQPVGADAAGALALVFPAGGALTQAFEVESFDVPGTARIDVIDADTTCPESYAEVQVLEPGATDFGDDFAQADGPPENWTVFTGDWQVAGEALVSIPAGVEEWVWAGSPPIRFEQVERIACTLAFGDAPLDVVGRHGGLMFYARAAATRGATSGYTIDWIDRQDAVYNDHGYRFLRWENGVQYEVVPPTRDLFAEPGTQWEIVFDGDTITFSVDGELVFTATDVSFRDGYIGAWMWSNGTTATIDDFAVGTSGPKAPRASFTATPQAGGVPLDVSFDASASRDGDGTITAYAWDFGDGQNGTGVTTTHRYATAGTFTAKLTVTDNDGMTGTATTTITVTQGGTLFKRGDTNSDGRTNIADAICLLGYLFGPSTDPCKVSVPRCRDGADANNDGNMNIADAIMVLGYLFNFAKTGNLPEPFLACGSDPADPPDSLDCTTFAPCAR